jgi:hypothetical protein
MHKPSSPWEGPFIVTEVVSPSTYRLQWGDGQGGTKPLERGAPMTILSV